MTLADRHYSAADTLPCSFPIHPTSACESRRYLRRYYTHRRVVAEERVVGEAYIPLFSTEPVSFSKSMWYAPQMTSRSFPLIQELWVGTSVVNMRIDSG